MKNGTVSLISIYNLSLIVYRNTRDFCVLILYPTYLPNSLMSSSNFLVSFLGFPVYNISSAKSEILFLIFQIRFLLYIFILLFTCLGLLRLCWRKVVRVENLSYSRSYRKCFQFFSIKNICYGFVIYGLYYIEVGSLYTHFLYSFYYKWVLNFVIIIWFLFNLLAWCIMVIDLHILKNLCIPGIHHTWPWCMILSMCC